MKRFIQSLGLLALLLAACAPQGPTGTEVTVRLFSPVGEGSPATATVVYQVGEDEWRLATQRDYGVYTFTLPAGEKRYGVAVNCIPGGLMLGTLGWANVYLLTTEDTVEIQVSCLNLSDLTLSEVAVEAKAGSGETGYNRAWYHGILDSEQKSFGNAATLVFEAKPDRDLLILAYDDGSIKWAPHLIRRIRFVRDLNASVPQGTPSAETTYTLTAADEPDYANVSAFPVPSWAGGGSFFGVGFVSKQGVVVPHSSKDPDNNPALGTGDATGGRYAKVPNTAPGDVYCAEAAAYDGTHTYYTGEVRVMGPEGPDLSFSLPMEKFDPSVTEAPLPSFANLAYDDPDLVGYAFSFVFSGFSEMVVVSKGWLGDQESFTMPDLTDAPDFHGTKPLKGEHVSWRAMAVMTEDLGAFLRSEPLPLANPLPRTPGFWAKLATKAGEYDVP